MRRVAPFLALFAVAAIAFAPAARGAGTGKLYLTWRAPYGSPRASDTLSTACRDTADFDTLYLSFDPGETDTTLLGMQSTLYFHAANGDTLGPYWQFWSGKVKQNRMLVTFERDSLYPQPSPWSTTGAGRSFYDHTRASGRLRVVYAIPYGKAGPVRAGTVYQLGRIMLRHPDPAQEQCGQPMCIEWNVLALSYRISEDEHAINGGSRFASFNSPGGAVCRSFRPAVATRAWQPRPPTPRPAAGHP